MMPSSSKRPRKLAGSLFRTFLRRRDGSTAIEFSILIIPFALLVFAILESSISFAAQQVMTNAADDVARMYRTGQLRAVTEENSDAEKKKIRDMICGRMEIMVSKGCPGLSIDLRTETEFSDFDLGTPFDNGDLDESQLGFGSGGAGTKNMLRVYYRWPIITDLMRYSMSTINGGKTLHFAAVTWQNEPYAE